MKEAKRSKKWSSVLIIILLCGAGAQFIRTRTAWIMDQRASVMP